MSEITKPVEEPVAAPAAAIPATEPVAETKAVEEPSVEAPVVTEPVAAEEPVVTSEDVKPVEEGVLSIKGPGLIKSIFPSKKFFWLGSEAVEEKSLSSYLRGEKDTKEANHNIAWASHTGKGLLFFSKTAAEKANPAGVINLAEISEVTTDGSEKLHFTAAGSKYTLGASTTAERDVWVSLLKSKSAEAKELAPSVIEHETYKNKLESLKPTAIVAPAPKKSLDLKKEEKTEDKKAENKDGLLDAKKRTSRSASRKRNSVFGTFGLGKKEEAVEPKAEETTAVTLAEPSAPIEDVTPAEAAAPPAVAEPVVAEETAPTTETAPPVEEAVAPVKPANTKRNSFFGTLGSKLAPKKETKTEAEDVAPAVPSKDTEVAAPVVAETAPVIPAVEAGDSLAASTLTPATVPTTDAETKTVEPPLAVKDKRKSSLPWLSKKEKAGSDSETEKPKSNLFSTLRNTVKGEKAKKSPTTETPVTTEETPATEAKVEEPIVEAPVAEEPVVEKPISAAPASAPIVATTA